MLWYWFVWFDFLFLNVKVIAFFAIVAVATAAVLPAHSGADATAETLRSDSVVNPDSFEYAYETSNGIRGM